MNIITIPQLRLGQLQSLTEQTLKITAPFEVLAPYTASVQAAFDPFLTGMQKETSASDKKTLDRTRDRYLSGFFYSMEAESYYPTDDPVAKEVVKKLLQITEKYGFKINKQPYDEETAAIDNLLAELAKIDLSTMPHLERWTVLIKAANADFKAASQDYLQTTVTDSKTKAASALAPALITELENLYTMSFAFAKTAPDEQLTKAYQELSELVNTYR
ncbi:hypothetical protein KO507_09805 [Gilvimarinus agarilyticus]|nr:hypothetical protein [Gilvimarinus agarilyticus]